MRICKRMSKNDNDCFCVCAKDDKARGKLVDIVTEKKNEIMLL